MNFLITGCGKSGTHYTVRLLNALGVLTAHQTTQPDRLLAGDPVEMAPRHQGECSWYAAYQLPDGVPTVLQVRNPLDTVKSLLKVAAFRDANTARVKLIEEACGIVRADMTEKEFTVAYWALWNLMIRAKGVPFVRVEDLRTADGVSELLAHITPGHTVTEARIMRAIAQTPSNEGSLGKYHRTVDLLSEDITGHLLKAMEVFGYETPSGT